MPYKNFTSFTNITPIFGNPKEMNYGFKASPIAPCEKHNDFDDDFFLIYRRSEYAAQIELACAKIFKMLMGYGPEMEIIHNGDDFFIASRSIKGFQTGYPKFDEIPFQNILGFAATRVIYYFLCGTDNHSGNFGVQKSGQYVKCYRIDMPEAFMLEMLNNPLTLNSLERIPYIVEKGHESEDGIISVPVSYVTSKFFQDEKKAMIKKIADTPFSQFEEIIRETVTADHYSHIQSELASVASKMLLSEKEMQKAYACFAAVNAFEHSLPNMISLFKARHERWKLLVEQNLEISQDLYLSDPINFQNKMDVSASESSEDENDRDDAPDFEQKTIEYHANRFFPVCVDSQDTMNLQLGSITI